jgi:Zn-dependent peptidase ImmA (M78 family)/transcriptional regulator with XRE-family HTH domain
MDELHIKGGGPTLGERLKSARTAKGWSTRSVAEMLSPRIALSHATIANYEKNATRPPIDVMTAFARIYERPLNWFLGQGAALTGVRYRNLKSKVGVKDRHRFEGECQRWFDAYLAIESHLGDPLKVDLTFKTEPGEAPANAASRLRELLKLDEDDRVTSVCDVLQRLGCRVMEIETDLAIDGLAARLGDEDVVMLNCSVSNDRARMDAAHELAHVVYDDCRGDEESKEQEKAAFEFASRFLLTSAMLREAFKRKSVVELFRFKSRFGISAAAMIYRAKAEELITESEAKMLWIEFAKRGWKAREPGQVWPDRATRFEAIIDEAVVGGKATLGHLAEIAGVREDELRRRLALATGADNYDASMEDHPAERQGLRIAR